MVLRQNTVGKVEQLTTESDECVKAGKYLTCVTPCCLNHACSVPSAVLRVLLVSLCSKNVLWEYSPTVLYIKVTGVEMGCVSSHASPLEA